MQNASLSDRTQAFRIHAFVFVAVMIGLGVINALTGGPWWVLWILPFWAIGLFAHWFFALGPGRPAGGA